mmetsp:Transcript_11317/g.18322  ORF Transcript_11317/g.18322 Transcript_11317/m.18322 type:complete len:860 (-) Transcript_11317:9724-12303(-)
MTGSSAAQILTEQSDVAAQSEYKFTQLRKSLVVAGDTLSGGETIIDRQGEIRFGENIRDVADNWANKTSGFAMKSSADGALLNVHKDSQPAVEIDETKFKLENAEFQSKSIAIRDDNDAVGFQVTIGADQNAAAVAEIAMPASTSGADKKTAVYINDSTDAAKHPEVDIPNLKQCHELNQSISNTNSDRTANTEDVAALTAKVKELFQDVGGGDGTGCPVFPEVTSAGQTRTSAKTRLEHLEALMEADAGSGQIDELREIFDFLASHAQEGQNLAAVLDDVTKEDGTIDSKIESERDSTAEGTLAKDARDKVSNLAQNLVAAINQVAGETTVSWDAATEAFGTSSELGPSKKIAGLDTRTTALENFTNDSSLSKLSNGLAASTVKECVDDAIKHHTGCDIAADAAKIKIDALDTIAGNDMSNTDANYANSHKARITSLEADRAEKTEEIDTLETNQSNLQAEVLGVAKHLLGSAVTSRASLRDVAHADHADPTEDGLVLGLAKAVSNTDASAIDSITEIVNAVKGADLSDGVSILTKFKNSVNDSIGDANTNLTTSIKDASELIHHGTTSGVSDVTASDFSSGKYHLTSLRSDIDESRKDISVATGNDAPTPLQFANTSGDVGYLQQLKNTEALRSAHYQIGFDTLSDPQNPFVNSLTPTTAPLAQNDTEKFGEIHLIQENDKPVIDLAGMVRLSGVKGFDPHAPEAYTGGDIPVGTLHVDSNGFVKAWRAQDDVDAFSGGGGAANPPPGTEGTCDNPAYMLHESFDDQVNHVLGCDGQECEFTSDGHRISNSTMTEDDVNNELEASLGFGTPGTNFTVDAHVVVTSPGHAPVGEVTLALVTIVGSSTDKRNLASFGLP